jgi:uncharacterized damage-inducible protein DinB
MSLAKILLSELDQEAATTRRCIERFSDDQLGWKPHEKSMSVRQLISHLAEIPGWTAGVLQKESLDLMPPGGGGYQPAHYATVAETVEAFDRVIAKCRENLLAITDESIFGQPWSLLAGGEKIFTLPRAAVMRVFVLSHLIHHRGQLSVYLRLLDIPVPSIYGPSADEAHLSPGTAGD